jgi:ubiquinone/menaquinone biosynthesis C-methylase UbiE
MKILESAPRRYDKGIYLLTLGRLNKAYHHLTLYIQRGQRVLDLGCGTMARHKNLANNIALYEMGVAELGNEKSESYDIMMSGLCFSELTDNELTYVLKQVKRILKPGGLLLVADEPRPKNIVKRIFHFLIRSPLVIITFIITQTTTHAVKNLSEKIRETGLPIESIQLSKLENFIRLVGKKLE